MDILPLSDFLTTCADKIVNEKCVLFLGPGFGQTADGQKVHDVVKAKLLDHYKTKAGFDPKERLDTQFDNIFILKNNKSLAELFEFRSRLGESYKSLAPHPIYQRIAQLPFKAIISCSPDNMLRQSFLDQGYDPDFFYFSPKGQPNRTERPNVPIIYNLFGWAEDPDSFLISYEHFFKFVFSMMGEKGDLPINLRNIIREAEVFILLGLDMEKWYVPLLLRRLNQEKMRTDEQKLSVFEKNIANLYPYSTDDEQKLAAQLFVVEVTEEQGPLVNSIVKMVEQRGALRTAPVFKKPTKTALAREHLRQDKLLEAMQVFAKICLNENKPTMYVDQTSGRLAQIDGQKQIGTISENDYATERNKIRTALLTFADELDTTN